MSHWMTYLPYWMSIIAISKLWMPLNKELFQLQKGEQETVSDWGIHLSRHL